MKLNEMMTIIKRTKDEAFYGEKNGASYVVCKTNPDYQEWSDFYDTMRNTPFADRSTKLIDLQTNGLFPMVLDAVAPAPVDEATAEPVPEVVKTPAELLVEGIQKLMDFFSEFAFVPSFRFTNTFAYMCQQSAEQARTYVHNYFALMDSSYLNEVVEKTKSDEFSGIVELVKQYGAPTQHINTRFKIYYGSAGTGKTTLAQEEAENRCIVCNSSMLPSDLMEDFIFKDGNPDFNPSLLWNCMEQGKTIVLDEINLLPFDSLRFLQGIVDGKTEFYYKNRPVRIHDGFQIIGTMNLSLGGMTYGLPEPLVDRCSDAREFVLSAAQLATAIIGREDGE